MLSHKLLESQKVVPQVAVGVEHWIVLIDVELVDSAGFVTPST